MRVTGYAKISKIRCPYAFDSFQFYHESRADLTLNYEESIGLVTT